MMTLQELKDKLVRLADDARNDTYANVLVMIDGEPYEIESIDSHADGFWSIEATYYEFEAEDEEEADVEEEPSDLTAAELGSHQV
jgi:hypothetical protein